MRRMAPQDKQISPEPIDAGLEKVREIVIGPHARDVEKRLARLEQALGREIAGLREELLRRVDTLERFMRTELDALNERLAAEQRARGADVQNLTAELRQAAQVQGQRVDELADRTAKSGRELRELVLDQSKALRDELKGAESMVLSVMRDETRALDHGKVDRGALAELLTELASRLAGPTPDEARVER